MMTTGKVTAPFLMFALLALLTLPYTSRADSAPFKVLLPVVAADSSPATPVLRMTWFWKPPAASDFDTVIRNFQDYVLTRNDEDEREALRAGGEQGPFLMYLLLNVIQDPGSCTADPWNNQVAYHPGDFCRLSSDHPDWFLRDSAGNRISSDGFYSMDPANPGWRSFWLSRAQKMLTQGGWDGVFIDNADGGLGRFRQIGQMPVRYSDDVSWQVAQEAFLRFLYHTYFLPSGRPVYANLTERADSAVWTRYLQYLDGAMDEGWAVDWDDGYLSARRWEEHLLRAEAVQEQGKMVYLVSQGAQGDLARQEFAFASYLLVANGRAAFRYANAQAYDEVWLYPSYNLQLGDPKGSRYWDGTAWRRDFARGVVRVNPSTQEAELKSW